MPLQKARNIIMSFKPKPYSLRIMEERPPSSMSTWGRVSIKKFYCPNTQIMLNTGSIFSPEIALFLL